ncbi:methyltransferase domain-containing protein [Acetoanaerobium sticklandii]|uniref:methyltransferase domain-containing protein n=1 Tax=Acetoanaerobium sticklandii TaxID=1511 RepID=UPI003A8E660F
MNCRHCNENLDLTLVNLGVCPPSNAYLKKEDLDKPETFYPLEVLVCEKCWLVQTKDFNKEDELFTSDYAYFSSFSTSWLKHCENFVNTSIERFDLTEESKFVEVAANDGYLLKFVKDRGIPCYGVEPTNSTANAAREKGIEIVEEFFGVDLATKLVNDGGSADFTCAKNVLAHVPDINDFVAGFEKLLKPEGVCTFEFPHLYELISNNQFDTIYHEHYSYLSLLSVKTIFEKNGLTIFDVAQLPTHGGSLRVFAQKTTTGNKQIEASVANLLAQEVEAGMNNVDYYKNFERSAKKVKDDFLEFLIKHSDKKIVGYGAAAKGNTLLNYGGVKHDSIDFVVDRSPSKIGKYLPGSRIRVATEEELKSEKPDYVVIFPWNLKTEIEGQLSYIREWGGRFVTAVPELSIF